MSNPALSSDFQIATLVAGTGALVTLASLGIVNPHPTWIPAVSKAKLGDNSARLLGAPQVVWSWGFIQGAQRDILKTYCPNASAVVYLITPTVNVVSSVPNASQRYICQMIWQSPESPEDPQTGRRLNFSITFRQLVSV